MDSQPCGRDRGPEIVDDSTAFAAVLAFFSRPVDEDEPAESAVSTGEGATA